MSVLITALLIEKHGRLRLTMRELADELGWSYSTLRNKLAAGQCPVRTYLDGGTRFADVRDVVEYLDRCRAAARVEGSGTHAQPASHI